MENTCQNNIGIVMCFGRTDILLAVYDKSRKKLLKNIFKTKDDNSELLRIHTPEGMWFCSLIYYKKEPSLASWLSGGLWLLAWRSI